MDLKDKKFVASFSGGKDGMLSLYRAIKMGMKPVMLITSYNTQTERSWFHYIAKNLFEAVSASLDIPILFAPSEGDGANYAESLEEALKQAKKAGAEIAVFGDIDIQRHHDWCTARCENVEIEPYFPLWQESRDTLVNEFLDEGFEAVINIVDTNYLPKDFAGRILSKQTVEQIKAEGADACGENGEYHTFVFNGPIFQNKVEYSIQPPIELDQYIILPLDPK